jgi:enoyl-CoA hydratase
MDYQNIGFQKEENIGILTVDRPKALNALNTETIEEMRTVFKEVKMDDDLRVLIITGSGDKAFIAGADIGEIQGLTLKNGLEFLQAGHQMNRDIETMGKPTIAAVNGLALGGGCEFSMACSLRIISEKAKFGLPELGLGVIPGYGGTQRLARLIGKGRALWYLLTGDMIDASTAMDLGLANMVTSPEELMDKTLALKNSWIKPLHWGRRSHPKAPLPSRWPLWPSTTVWRQIWRADLPLRRRSPVWRFRARTRRKALPPFSRRENPHTPVSSGGDESGY